MKYLVIALLAVGSLSTLHAAKTKYICTQQVMGTTFTTVFATKEECNKSCRGGVCEETGIDTSTTDSPDESPLV